MTAIASDHSWPAPGKINLFLHVTGRRADGYHELQTAFQFLDVGDVLWFEVTRGAGIELQGGIPGIPAGRNLIVRAARLLANHTSCRQGVRIRLQKQLPVGGGLGGGSSDAATTLVVLNALWGLGLATEQLAALGLQLGADVPVFIHGAAAWAEGVGEKLTPLTDLAEPWYLVVSPALSVPTAEIFSDPQLTRNAHPITIPAFLAGAGVNHLQPVVVRRYPEVGKLLNWLSKILPARMTGSGACVFAPCQDRYQAESILQQLPVPWTGFVARGRNRSPLLERLERVRA